MLAVLCCAGPTRMRPDDRIGWSIMTGRSEKSIRFSTAIIPSCRSGLSKSCGDQVT